MGPYEASLRAHHVEIRERLMGHIEHDEPADEVGSEEEAVSEHCGMTGWPLQPPIIIVNRLRIIRDEVAAKHGLTVLEMMSKRKTKKLNLARFEFWYRAYTETPRSFPEIGRFSEDRDHTTVMHGVRRHCQINDIPLPEGMTPGKPRRSRWTPRSSAPAQIDAVGA